MPALSIVMFHLVPFGECRIRDELASTEPVIENMAPTGCQFDDVTFADAFHVDAERLRFPDSV